jgi:hypothetical protein
MLLNIIEDGCFQQNHEITAKVTEKVLPLFQVGRE